MLNRFSLEIRTDNDAFADDPAAEVVRILKGVVTALERGTRGAPLHDINGNRVGRFDLERADD